MTVHNELPFEMPSKRNFPEAWALRQEIQDITQYTLGVQDALALYNEGVHDKIDVNTAELQNYIIRFRSVCDTLGAAPNVFFDVLLELRAMQGVLQDVLRLSTHYGSLYVGTPTKKEGGV